MRISLQYRQSARHKRHSPRRHRQLWSFPARLLVAALAIIAGSTFVSTSNAGASSSVTMNLSAGFNGQYRPGTWLQISADIVNNGPDISGRLVFVDMQTNTFNGPSLPYHTDYARAVALPSGAHKRVTLMIPTSDLLNSSVTLELRNGSGIVITHSSLTLNPLSGSTLSMGIAASDKAAQAAFSGLTIDNTSISPVTFSPADLPDTALALRNLDALALAGSMGAGISPDQSTALHDWVNGGGVLILMGGPNAAGLQAGLPDDLRPVTLTGTATLPALPALAQLAHLSKSAATATGAVVVSSATLRPGAAAIVSQGSVPLVVDLPHGQGHVIYVAFDPLLAPLTSWSSGDLNAFWTAALSRDLSTAASAAVVQNSFGGGNSSLSFNNGPTNNPWVITNALSNLPANALPSPQFLIIVLAIYVLALGPVNFLVLRRWRKLDWAWGTIPSLALIFGIGTYAFALQGKGADILTKVVSVEQIFPDSPISDVTAYVGLFSPARGDYTLSTAANLLGQAIPGNGGFGNQSGSSTPLGLEFSQGDATTSHVQFRDMSMWSMRNVALSGNRQTPGGIATNLTLTAKGTLSGTITNHTGHTIVDAAVTTAVGFQVLGTFRAGQTVPLSLDTSASAASNGGPPPLYQLYQVLNAGRQNSSSDGSPGISRIAAVRIIGSRQVYLYGKGGTYNWGPTYYGSNGSIPRWQEEQNIISGLFNSGSTASYGPVVFLGWTTDPQLPLTVNGVQPKRFDLNLVLTALPFGLRPGPFTLGRGVVAPHLIAAGNNGPSGPGGLNIAPGDSVTVEFDIPYHGTRVLGSTLDIGLGLSGGQPGISGLSGRLYNWQTHQWVGIDLSTQQATIKQATPYVSPSGAIRLQLTAPASGNVYIGDIGSSVQLGVTGRVQ